METTVNLKAALKTCQTLYDRNYAMLEKAKQGTPEWKYHIKQEQKLERQHISILRKLGEYIDDPCPTHSKLPCAECTGWYSRKPVRNMGGKKVYKMVLSEKGKQCKVK